VQAANGVQDAEALLKELNDSLGVFTDHNVRCFILVEGRNDIAGLRALSKSLEAAAIPGTRALSELEAEGRICFLPIGGGGSASLWYSNLSPFSRHEVHIMDSDRKDPIDPIKPEMKELLKTAGDKRHVFVLDRREMENYLTLDSVLHVYSDIAGFDTAFHGLVSDSGNWDYLDLPSLCARAVQESATPDSALNWDELTPETQKRKESKAKKRLANCFTHPSVSADLGKTSPDIVTALQKIISVAGTA
jgi:hypothetical protein